MQLIKKIKLSTIGWWIFGSAFFVGTISLKPKLHEIDGVVSWKMLKSVEVIEEGKHRVRNFPPAVRALDNARVRLQGFMVVLETGSTQRHFILSADEPACPFCVPGGPHAIVDVEADVGLEPAYGPIVVDGKLVLVKDSAEPIYYRLQHASLSHEGRS